VITSTFDPIRQPWLKEFTKQKWSKQSLVTNVLF